MASDEASYWLVTVPNEKTKNADQTFSHLRSFTSSSRADLAEMHRFEIPSLLVGTLDSLMSLSDDLQKVDMSVENVVRKIQRQYLEETADGISNDHVPGVAGHGEADLRIDGRAASAYLHSFNWDKAKFPDRRPLPEMVKLIQSGVAKKEEELKQIMGAYTEKKQKLSIASRGRGGGALSTADLKTVLTSEVVSASDFINTEYLKTMVAVVPKSAEKNWLSTYHTLASDIAGYGPESDNRMAVRGSPVVPGSARMLHQVGETMLYAVTILKGQYQAGFYDDEGQFEAGVYTDFVEPFKQAARGAKIAIREYNFDPEAAVVEQRVMAQTMAEVRRLHSTMKRWCSTNFGEAFIAWMHIKAIRAFVESVLRYGLPVNFVAVLYRPNSGRENKLRHAITEYMRTYTDQSSLAFALDDDEKDKGTDFSPFFVSQFKPFA